MPALGESALVHTPDGRCLHACLAGTGPTTVLFESGLGDSRNAWMSVAGEIAAFARTVVYDRAGYGRSDPGTDDRTVRRLADDHLTVRHALIEGPVVLVGHSYGGLISRLSAADDPTHVCGLVAVDEVSELCAPVVDGTAMRGAGLYYRGRHLLARAGLLARLDQREMRHAAHAARTTADPGDRIGDMLAEVRREHAHEDATVRSTMTALRELHSLGPSLRRAAVDGPYLPGVTMTSISARRVAPGSRRRDPIGAAHRETIQRNGHGRHVTAATRSHRVHVHEPRIVIDRIREIVAEADRTSTAPPARTAPPESTRPPKSAGPTPTPRDDRTRIG